MDQEGKFLTMHVLLKSLCLCLACAAVEIQAATSASVETARDHRFLLSANVEMATSLTGGAWKQSVIQVYQQCKDSSQEI